MRDLKGAKSRKAFDVYDFDDEVEGRTEADSAKKMEKFQNYIFPRTKRRRTEKEKPIDKYDFLQHFSSHLDLNREDNARPCINQLDGENDQEPKIMNRPKNVHRSSKGKTKLDEVLASTGSNEHNALLLEELNNDLHVRKDSASVGHTSDLQPSAVQHFSDNPLVNISTDVLSEEKESCESLSGPVSISASNIEENEGCLEFPLSKGQDVKSGNMSQRDMDVTIDVDSVKLGNNQYGKSRLTFTADHIKFVCLDANDDDKKFVAEWCITDINRINCQWSGCAAAALVELHFRRKRASEVEEYVNDYDPLKLMFSVKYVLWMDKLLKIKNLTSKYNDILSTKSSDCSQREDDAVSSIKVSSCDYFSDSAEHFVEVVYPKGDPDAVCLSKSDIELLQPETFLNDTIIDFYIKYLNNKIHPNEKHRFHFFNSFFFRKLADLDKRHVNSSKGRTAFMRVRKWTRKLNIFEKDYIFIPVNFNLHWSLIVICYPGEIGRLKDGDAKDSAKLPCILHMDSIKGSHRSLKTIIQSYIWEEWKERNPGFLEDNSSNSWNLRFVALDLPQQENAFDCGLFLLHYAELFLQEVPSNFSPLSISKVSSFLTSNWFLPAEASMKRSFIRKMIYELQKDPSQEVPSILSNSHLLGSGNTENNNNGKQHLELHYDIGCLDKQPVIDSTSGVFQCDEQTTGAVEEFPKHGTDVLPSTEPIEHLNVRKSERQLVSGSLAAEHLHTLCGHKVPEPCETSVPLTIAGVNPVPVSTGEESSAIQNPSHCLNENLAVKAERVSEKLHRFDYVSDSSISSEDGYVEDSEEADMTRLGDRVPDCQVYDTNRRKDNYDYNSSHVTIKTKEAEATHAKDTILDNQANLDQRGLKTAAMKPDEKNNCMICNDTEIRDCDPQKNVKRQAFSNLQKFPLDSARKIVYADNELDDDDVQLIETRAVDKATQEPVKDRHVVCVVNTQAETPDNDSIKLCSGSCKRQKHSTVPLEDLVTIDDKSSRDSDVQLIESMPSYHQPSRRVTRSVAKKLFQHFDFS